MGSNKFCCFSDEIVFVIIVSNELYETIIEKQDFVNK